MPFLVRSSYNFTYPYSMILLGPDELAMNRSQTRSEGLFAPGVRGRGIP